MHRVDRKLTVISDNQTLCGDVVDGEKWVKQQDTGIHEQIHRQAGVNVMEARKRPTLLVSKYEEAALQLAGTAPERKAYRKLLEREPTTVDTEGLMKAAEDGVVGFQSARKNLIKSTMEQLSAALRLALALSRNAKKLTAFYDHAFWDHKRPNQAKLVLACPAVRHAAARR